MQTIENLLDNKSDSLDYVFRVDTKTFGVKFYKTQKELLENWKNSMYELCSDFQMEASANLKWDFYLVLPCPFNKNDLDEKFRFEIEGDRFGCRKILFFNKSKNYDPKLLLSEVTPELILDKKVELISSANVIKDIKSFYHQDIEMFLTLPMNDSDVLSFIDKIQVKNESKN